MVHGTGVAQALLRAGSSTKWNCTSYPSCSGKGRRPFDDLPPDHVELGLLRQLAPDAADPGQHITHLCDRNRRP
jgi:hypothetical protein